MKASKVIGVLSLMFVMGLPSPSEGGLVWVTQWSKWSSCNIQTRLKSRFKTCVRSYWNNDRECTLDEVAVNHGYCKDIPGMPTIQVDGQTGGPVNFLEGVTTSLTCKPTERRRKWNTWGPPSYEWYHSSHQVATDWTWVGSNANLSVTMESGIYECRVGRTIGDANDILWSDRSKPIVILIKDFPTITGWPEHSTVEVGDTLLLKCAHTTAGSSADHDLSYSWYKDSAKLRGSRKADIYLKPEVDLSDAGEYSCQVKSDGIARNSTVRTLFVREAESWSWNCSTMWTRWMSRDPDTHKEYRYQFCGNISSRGRTKDWKLKEETRIKRVSTIEASFRSTTRTFTEALHVNSSDEYENMQKKFTSILTNAFMQTNISESLAKIEIIRFENGSVIVHYRVILKTSIPVTDPLPHISKILAEYLNRNETAANEFGIDPSFPGGSDGCVADQQTASQRVENSQNKAEVILAVTLTFIMLLIVAVVVLVVFLVRLKRSLHDKEPRGENVAFHAESNGSGPAVKMKDRKIPEAKSNFDPYAALGDKNVYADDDYGSLGEQKRIARPQGEKDNAAFETEDGEYLDIVGDGRMVPPSLQAELEDGYRGNEADAPVYHVLEHEPLNVTSDNRNEGTVYSLAEATTDPRSKITGGKSGDSVYAMANEGSQVGGDQGVESVYALAEGNSDVYAIPDKDKTGKGGAPVYSLAGRTRPKPAPGKTTSGDKKTPDTTYSLAGLPSGKPQPSQSLAGKLKDDSADYSQPYGRAPGAKYPDKNKMAAKGGQGKGKAFPSNDDGDEYSRLQLPTLTKPSTMQFLEKKPKQMKAVDSAQEDVQGDDDEDYEYSTACEVIT